MCENIHSHLSCPRCSSYVHCCSENTEAHDTDSELGSAGGEGTSNVEWVASTTINVAARRSESSQERPANATSSAMAVWERI